MKTKKQSLGDDKVFEEILLAWKGSSRATGEFWPDLADKYGYESVESIRSAFKRERAKRGVSFHPAPPHFPKVGIMDVETLPATAYVWDLWDQNIGLNQLIDDSCLLSWAGKYLNDPEVQSDILTPAEAKRRDPKRITKSAWEFLNSCDLIIGHNWKKFDAKVLNTYFLMYAKPVKVPAIDTLEICKNNFRFLSNKMVFINAKLGIQNKVDNDGFPLWVKCSRGDSEALALMNEYNVGDIASTEDLYYTIRAFAPNHPNLALYNEIEKEQCPVCLSQNLSSEGRYPGSVAMYEKLRCADCGSINRRRVNTLTKAKRKSMIAK